MSLDDIEAFEISEGSDALFSEYPYEDGKSMTQDLDLHYDVQGQDVTYTVTNNSQYDGYITVDILFMKDGKLVKFVTSSAVDIDNSEGGYSVAPGKTSTEVSETCPSEFDDVLVYCYGVGK